MSKREKLIKKFLAIKVGDCYKNDCATFFQQTKYQSYWA